MSEMKLTSAKVKNMNIGKSRERHPERAKDEVNRQRKVSGDGYVSRDGSQHPAVNPPSLVKVCDRCTKPGCDLLFAEREEIHLNYFTKSADVQNAILAGCIDVQVPAQNSGGQRAATNKYTLCYRGRKHDVCKAMFKDTFQIGDRKIRFIVEKMMDGDNAPSDERGKHDTRPHAIPQALMDDIRDHIRRFPTHESHYTRNQHPHLRYLDSELTVSNMHELFNDDQLQRGRPTCKEWVYYDIFNNEFPNIRLSDPKQDTCDNCDFLKSRITDATPNERIELIQRQQDHHHAVEAAFEAYNADKVLSKADPTYIVLTADLQQVIFTPGLKNSASFYLRKLSNYNFGIKRANDDVTFIYNWNEMDGKRGANEVASCIWKHLNSEYVRTRYPRRLILWMDRCTGQNNNQYVLSMLILAVRSRLISSFEQKFFITGHSYNDCDRSFGCIEKQLKSLNVYTPDDIEKAVINSSNVHPFRFLPILQQDILDFKLPTNRCVRYVQLCVTKRLVFKYGPLIANQLPIESYLFCRIDHSAGMDIRVRFTIQPAFSPQALFRAYQARRQIDILKRGDLRKLLEYLDGQAYAYLFTILEEQRELFGA